jgi:TusE/DsrC/DsvC family sulfur relay protein
MTDINKMMESPEADPAKMDRINDLADWDETKGAGLADQEGIRMTDEHWEVVHFLRDYYVEHGKARSGRELSEVLDDHFEARGGRKHLYRLFPNGPVVQASHIGGVPLPEYAKDGSFGYSM